MAKKPNILLVDQNKEDLLAIEAMLSGMGGEIVKAGSGLEALDIIEGHDLALIMLNPKIRDDNGVFLGNVLRENKRTKNIPIIFIASENQENMCLFDENDAWTVDYLCKPLDPEMVRSKVRLFIEIKKQHIELRETAEALKMSNQKMLDQQKIVIQEERLKVLLQMAGATAHELNQPLMILLGNIELMRMEKNNSEKLFEYVDKIEEAGRRIAEVTKKIQKVRSYKSQNNDDESTAISLDKEIKVLSVEDSEVDFQLISNYLKGKQGISLVRAKSISHGIRLARQEEPDLILLDYSLPDGNGMDFLLNLEIEGLNTPVVVITGQGDELVASKVIQMGAYEYLPKRNINNESLTRVINNALEKDGLKKEIRLAQKKMARMASTDDLTGLYNRRYIMENAKLEVSRADRYGNNLAFCIIDLDDFKSINDTYGHPAGDMILAKTAVLLKDCTRSSDLAGRYGGDEILLIIPNTPLKRVIFICERFRQKLETNEFEYEGESMHLTASVGIASMKDTPAPESIKLIKMADEALYQAKLKGRNRVFSYSALLSDG